MADIQNVEYLNPLIVNQAKELVAQGNVSGAWRLLADNGDGYADNAAVVTGDYRTAEERAYYELVKNHWENASDDSSLYRNYFDDVAKKHITNYLNMLTDGKVPRTNDIVQSYVDSLGEYEIPPEVAFDAYYEALTGNSFWADILKINPDRIDTDLNNYGSRDNLGVLRDDILETMADLYAVGGVFYLNEAEIVLMYDFLSALYQKAVNYSGTQGLYDAIEQFIKEGLLSSDSMNQLMDALGFLKGNEKYSYDDFELGKWLEGTDGNDYLEGTKGDDVIEGGAGFDVLEGGEGFDTYLASDGDFIVDSDQQGLVEFNGQDISGNKYVNPETGLYEDDNFIFQQAGNNLEVIDKNTGESITIENWNKDNNGLGIKFFKEDITISITDAPAAFESEMGLHWFEVSLSRRLLSDEELTIEMGAQGFLNERHYINKNGKTYNVTYSSADQQLKTQYTLTGGQQAVWYGVYWTYDDQIAESNLDIKFDVSVVEFIGDPETKIINQDIGWSYLVDDDINKRYDPLILDTNKDGTISTTPLNESAVYFDITGDGIKEKVGWVKSEDGFLVFDKNENGQIDGVNELFGNQDVNGFDELRQIADSNYDNVIDRKDELYNQLQIWNDHNQDGKVQDGELQSLQKADIQSIELDYVSTDIEIEGNLLTEASKYSDSDGNRELVADIQLNTDVKDTQLLPDDIPDFTVDESTYLLPQIKGTGLVYDSFIQYNLNPEFKALAETLSTDYQKLSSQFDTFLEHYSGYSDFVDEMKARYSVEQFDMRDADKQIWILEKFEAENTNTIDIEAYYHEALNRGESSFKTVVKDEELELKYQLLADKLESSFALQSVFQDSISSIELNPDSNEFFVADDAIFLQEVTEYLNNPSISIEEKSYFAEIMLSQSDDLEFNPNEIVEEISDRILKDIVRTVFTGEDVSFWEDGASKRDGILIATQGDDLISTNSDTKKILLNTGNDKVQTGYGKDTFYYRKGDGSDVIFDKGGSDKLVFGEGIYREDVTIKLVRNADLIIALNEEGKTFDELTDKITIVDWMKPDNRIEEIEFANGSLLKQQDVFDQFVATDGVEVVELGWGNDTLDAKGGDDVIKAGNGNDKLTGSEGNDRLEGGDGNDTYYYGRGDGQDTIIDTAGHDTLQFEQGITLDELMLKYDGQDLLIGLRDEDKSFEQLSDVITIKNYKNSSSQIETIYLDHYVRVNVDSIINKPTDDNDAITATDNDFVVDLLAGNDRITASNSANYVFGNLGDDVIATKGGNDVVEGGKGSDTLYGGAGNDTYIFNRGDGKDLIFDDNSFGYGGSQKRDAGEDTLYFGKDVFEDDVIIQQNGSDLIIALKDGDTPFEDLSDRVTIKNFVDSNNRIEHLKLSDGTELTLPDLVQATEEGDDILLDSSNENLQISALGGADFVHTGSGKDFVFGGRGTDDIFSGAGDDTLIGGDNDDFLLGGSGNDAYVFNIGDGSDTIFDDNRPGYVIKPGTFDSIPDTMAAIKNSGVGIEDAGADVLRFGTGITEEDLSYQQEGLDLIISVGSRGDQITIKDHFNPFNAIERANFSDGSSIVLPQTETPFVHTYKLGDGHYQINDSKSIDQLLLGDGIVLDDLLVQEKGNNLVIGFKSEGVKPSSLNSISLNNYLNSDNRIENLSFNDGSTIAIPSLTAPTDGDDILYLGDSHVSIDMSAGDDYVSVTGVTDKLVDGGQGNDQIVADSGNDTLVGGIGDDTLKGGAGDDVYIFNYGDGNDFIYDSAGQDRIRFGEGITSDDLVGKLLDNDFVIAIKEDGKTFDELSNRITIQNFIGQQGFSLEAIDFFDGTTIPTIDLMIVTDGDDFINFGQQQTNINLLGGNDNFISSSADDVVLGGYGEDVIQTGSGADTITGGADNDELHGGKGNDTYIFNRGDGQDIVNDEAGNDQIVFGEGITYEDIAFKQDGTNLTIALKEDGKSFADFSDKITITDWFNQTTNIESIQFYDGSGIDASTLANTILNPAADILLSKNGAEMRGGLGDDTYVYKKGDFTVIIDDGVYNGDIKINAGNDILQFEDITLDQVSLGIQDSDLVIKIDAGHDTYQQLKDYVVIRDWQDVNRGIESISFADGETLAIDKTAYYPELAFDENWITSRYYIYGAEDNAIEGSQFSEVIEAGAGNDVVNAYSGSDRLVGQAGNDTLNGGEGNDVYVFTRGDGQDTIIDSQGVDTLVFNGGIVESEILFEQDGNDLIVAIQEPGIAFADLADKVALKDWFTGVDSRVEYLALDGQEVIAIADLLIQPTEQADNLEFGDENNYVDALAGDDVIHIGGGDDVLAGNDGDDHLYAGAGNDVVSGDAGTDTLYGAEGNDTYLFGRGDGKDTIVEDDFNDWGTTGTDTLQFKEGVSIEDVILVQQGDDLIVGLFEEGKTFDQLSDQITLKKWSTYDQENSRDYSRAYYTVEQFSFADGTVWNMADIIANIASSTEDTIYGFNQNDTLAGQQGDDVLYGRLGDDSYVFNRGDGHDTIYDYGQKGDDTAYYDAGNDTLQFGDGIGANDLIFTIAENQKDLKIYIKEEGKDLDGLQDTLLLKDWTKANTRIENFVLQNGIVLDIANYLTPEPTENNDVLIYSNNADYIDALAGDDIVFAQGGNDTVLGHAGNDELQGGSGQDTLIGGEGDDVLSGGVDNDRLEGEAGSDRYVFNLGDGHDVINDYSLDSSEMDSIRFGTGISSETITWSRDENNLLITVTDQNSILVENWFAEEGYRIELIDFADGTSLTADEVELAALASENSAPVVVPQVVEQRVNTYPTNDSFSPHISSLDNNGYAVAWGNGNYTYYGEEDIFTQLYDSNGYKVGQEAMVNSNESNSQVIEDMVSLEGGGYVTVWRSLYQDGSAYGVYLQQYSNDGSAVGSEVQVNSYTDFDQSRSAVKALSDGGYVIAWESYLQDGDRSGIYLQQFSSIGEKVGIEVQVNSFTAGNQISPEITSLSDGYVVTWQSDGQDGSNDGVFLQQFDLNGNKVGTEQQVNTFTNGNQFSPEIMALSTGGYVVVWTSFDQDGSSGGIYLQQFSNVGDKVGDETQVNTTVDGHQYSPFIKELGDGNYVIAWDSNGASGREVYIQQFNHLGEKVGVEQTVNSSEAAIQQVVDITLLSDGDFVVTWETSESYYGGSSNIFSQEFNSLGEKQGTEQLVNSQVGSALDSVDVTALGDGGYAVAFNSSYETEEGGVYVQKFDSEGHKIGLEGMPRTDFSVWSDNSVSGNLDYIQDPDGDVLSYSASAENGDFVIDELGSWSYTPSEGFTGIENVVVSIDDGHGGVLNHTLTFDVDIGISITMVDPIVLDLNDNGITSVSINESNAYFDYDGDGYREHTAWQEVGDAQLVADLNFDGKISDGSEMFGEFTLLPDGSKALNGYEALGQYDSNGDRVIDNQDALFGNLSLWQDYNQNGKSEAGELTNIQLSEVTAIHLDVENGITFEQRQENGNTLLNETSYVDLDGNGITRNVGFVYNALDTITNNDTLSTQFYGSSLSGEDGDDTYLFNAGDGIVTVSDNGDGVDTLVFGENITPEQLIVRWDKANNGLIIGVKENADDESSIYDVTDKIVIHDWFEDSGAIETFEFADGSVLSRESLYEQYTLLAESQGLNARVLDVDGELAGGDFADVLYGAEGEEKLEGLAGNDYLRGLSGDDYLLAGSGNDTLEGGLGDDTLYSESGNDYYLYSRGDGKDLIQDFSGHDRLVFGEGITQEDVIIEQDGYDLLIGITEEGKSISELSDLIRIEGHFIAGFQIEQIELYSGEIIELDHNDVPDISSVAVSLLEDESFSGQLSVNGNVNGLVYEVESSSEFASFLMDENGQYTYTPNGNFNGQDSVTVKVTNAKGQTDTEVLSFVVESVNDAPTVTSSVESILLQNVRSQNGVVSVFDVDGDALSYSVSTQTLNGSLTIDSEGQWHYQADTLFIGQDSAVITVDDGQGGLVTQTLNFDVNVSTPVFDDNVVMLLEDNQASGAFNVVNPVGGDLSYELVSNSANGALTLDSVGNWEYTPNDNYNGSDSISIKVTNEYGLSATSTLNFDIESVNDAPILDNDQETVLLQDVRSSQGKVNAYDVEGDLLSYVVTQQADNGVISLDSEGNWNYQANALYLGQDSAVITVDDGLGGTVTQTLNFDINVSSPSLADSSVALEEDGTTNGVLNVINPIGGELTFELVSGSEHGELMLNNSGHWNYTPAANYNGEDAVTIKVTNEYGLSSSSNLSFSIEAVNDAPIVTTESESFTLTNIRDVDGKVEASDVDGDSLLYSVQGSPEHGSLVIDENGGWHYRADASFNGDDSAVIMIDDGNGGNVTTALNFTVEGYQYEGQDLIINDNSGGDTLVMNGVEKRDLQFRRQGDALSILVKDEATITLSNYFVDVLSGVDEIITDQGSISLAKDVITQMSPWDWWTFGDDGVSNLIDGSYYSDWIFGGNQSDVLLGSSGSDDIRGFAGNDTIMGGNGRDLIYGDSGDDNLYGGNQADYLYGGQGSDTLVGGAGNDELYAQNGNDLLVGGTGQDILKGGNGDDVYSFSKGDSIDLIRDTGGFDTIQFGEGVEKEDISFFMQNARLHLQYSDTDSVTITGQSRDDNQIERIELNDGSYMTNADIDLIVQQMSAFASENGIWRPDNNDIRNNEQMMQIVTSGWQI